MLAVAVLAVAGAAIRTPPATAADRGATPALALDAGGATVVPVTGDVVGVHDPHIVRQGDTYHLFSTGRGIQVRTSTDLVHWTQGADVFDPLPTWVADDLPDNNGDLWAPDVTWWGGRWHLYYTASVWIGALPTRDSAIGHATTPTLDPSDPAFGWTDHGPVVESRGAFPTDGTVPEGWNAIDAAVAIDEHGDPWLSWGSAFDGIFVQRLGADGRLLPGSSPTTIARRSLWFAVVEAANPVHHDGAWWLFASYDYCCHGVDSTYNVRVGRADAITGPYLDRHGDPLVSTRAGRPPRDGLGSPVLAAYGEVRGPGHQHVFVDDGTWWIAHHWYDPALDGRSRLGLRPLDWGADGWPVARGAPPARRARARAGTERTGHDDGAGIGTERCRERRAGAPAGRHAGRHQAPLHRVTHGAGGLTAVAAAPGLTRARRPGCRRRCASVCPRWAGRRGRRRRRR